jgi:hypothetical protein
MCVSSRFQYGSIASWDQPAAPAATQSAKSPGGGMKLIIVLCEEQPPRTRARACRMREFPRGWATIG